MAGHRQNASLHTRRSSRWRFCGDTDATRYLLDLTGDTTRARLDLLVVPPETAAAAARQAFTAASDRANRRTPTAVLASLHPAAAPVPPPRPAADRAAAGKAAPAGAEAKG
jgi:hypothetical protein